MAAHMPCWAISGWQKTVAQEAFITAWQKLNLLAHNINVGFQVDILQRPRARTAKRTASFAVSSIRTVRFEWLNRAARLVAPAGAQILRLTTNPAVQDAFTRAATALDRAA